MRSTECSGSVQRVHVGRKNMGNLIKYEWRKQRQIYMILILACLLAFVVLFVAGSSARNDTLVGNQYSDYDL